MVAGEEPWSPRRCSEASISLRPLVVWLVLVKNFIVKN